MPNDLFGIHNYLAGEGAVQDIKGEWLDCAYDLSNRAHQHSGLDFSLDDIKPTLTPKAPRFINPMPADDAPPCPRCREKLEAVVSPKVF